MTVSAGVSALVTGRPGWWVALGVGVLGAIVGGIAMASKQSWGEPTLIIAAIIGGAGLIFLILSYLSGGKTD